MLKFLKEETIISDKIVIIVNNKTSLQKDKKDVSGIIQLLKADRYRSLTLNLHLARIFNHMFMVILLIPDVRD